MSANPLAGRRRRFGIAGKLWLALGAVAGITVVASLVAWLFAVTMGGIVERIADERKDAFQALSALSQRVNLLAASAPAIVAVDTLDALDRERLRLLREEAALQEVAQEIRNSRFPERWYEDFQVLSGRMNVNLQMLSSAQRQILLANRNLSSDVVLLESIRKELSIAVDEVVRDRRLSDADRVTFVRISSEIDRAIGLLNQAAAASGPEDLVALETSYARHLEHINSALEGIADPSLRTRLRQTAIQLAAIAPATGGMFALHQSRLEARKVAADMLHANRQLAEQMSADVAALLADVESSILRDAERAAVEIHRTKFLLLIFSGASLVVALAVGWLYIRRNILARVAALSTSMRAIAGGQINAVIPTGGRDEISDMASALTVFRSTTAAVAEAKENAARARMQLLNAIESTSEGFALYDEGGDLVLCNAKFASFFPLLEQEGFRSFQTLMRTSFSHGDVQPTGSTTAWLAEGSSGGTLEARLKDGRWITLSRRRTTDGGKVTVVSDVTDLKMREAELLQKSILLQATLDNISQGISVFGRDLKLAAWNQRFLSMFDIPAELGRVGTSLEDLVGYQAANGEFGEGAVEDWVRRVSRSLVERGEASFEHNRPNGTVIETRRNAMPDGGFVATFADITGRRRAEQRIQHLATHDGLTGLANRALFQETLEKSISKCRRDGTVGAMLFFDLDNFKDVNDSLGHSMGDDLLRAVSRRLMNSIRGSDTAARLGGDEFAVILSDLISAEEAGSFADRVADALSTTFSIDDCDIDVSASIGIAVFPIDGEDAVTIMQNADMAMYRAKAEGRGLYRFFASEMGEQVRRRSAIRSELRLALERNEFQLVYQPKMDLRTGRVVGSEALLRWHHPERGSIPPQEFIPVAENSGLILPIGEWVIEEACRQMRDWQAEAPSDARVAVNLSSVQFRRSDVVSLVDRALTRTGLDPRHLGLEITESVIMDDHEAALRTIRALSQLGIELAVDDFGTGYSSLSYLKRFDVHTVKIDRSFVQNLHEDADDAMITRAVITLAHSLNLKVVAEGVETAAHVDFLRAEGCDQAQGYFYYRPLPAAEMGKLLRQMSEDARMALPAE